jgi:hypothetical protein
MVTAMEAAQKAARKAIERTYQGMLVVTEHRKVKDEKSKLTNYQDVIVLENQPCKLSFERLQTAVQSESAASVAQTTKLFLSPDIVIKANSKITVTQTGVTSDYKSSGIPAVYQTHQEIILDLFKGWT